MYRTAVIVLLGSALSCAHFAFAETAPATSAPATTDSTGTEDNAPPPAAPPAQATATPPANTHKPAPVSGNIEISEYLDHLHQQFVASKLVSTEQGRMINQGKIHIELYVTAEKKRNGEIRSYVLQNKQAGNALAHRLTFDIVIPAISAASTVRPSERSAPTPSPVAAAPTATAPPPATPEKQTPRPWYRNFFTW